MAQLIEARTNIYLASQNAPDAIANTGTYSGQMPNPADFAAVYGAEEGGKQYQDFSLRMDVGRQAFGMRTTPNQAIHAALRDAEPGPGSSNEEQRRYQVTAAAALKTLSMRREDSAGYARPNVDAAWRAATGPDSKSETSDPEVYKWAIAVSVAAQRQLGVATLQPLPRAIAQSLADTFSDEGVPQADKDIILRDLLAAAPDPGVREALSQQLDLVGRSRPAQVDPITTAATGQGQPPSVHPGEPQSAFQQATEDFGNYLSESFEALGRAPHDIGLFLRDLRDDPLDALGQLPVTSASGTTAGGAAGLRWLGTRFANETPVAESLATDVGRAFSKKYQRNFFKKHPQLIGKVFIHHKVEQDVLNKYPGLFDDDFIHSLENLSGIPNSLNSTLHLRDIRLAWNQFYREVANPTKQQFLDKVAEIDRKFGHLFNPPVGK
ncbi:hypothetical protein ACFSQQ_19470 [Mesorhizobium kowhaii]|uniref:hypothetical protein n=1 Tax=Mesorhizobium kowhaii TaxID=1300272 RepID=UPI003635A0E5